MADRTAPPYALDERPMLEKWLDFHRATLESISTRAG